jgi:hypothetical protein
LFTHTDGILDEVYRRNVPTSKTQLGQRVTVTEEMCRQAIADTRERCRAIAALVTP